jgi:glyoxalase family protein
MTAPFGRGSESRPEMMLLGLHHVTTLAGDPRLNLDFYTRVAGMRLVKRTVNFDDPAGYHFYFSAGAGTPGTLLTFFPWVKGRRGVRGSGQVVNVVTHVPKAPPGSIADPDGIGIELIESAETPGLQSVTLCAADAGPTVAFLRDVLGLRIVAVEANRTRLEMADGGKVEVLHSPGTPRGKMAVGMVHHVALRVADEDAQLEWRERLIRAGLRVSPVKDRLYFHSIYFREPGGALLEIATDGPGFTLDESADRLGQRLCLPPWLEPVRESIERRLPPLSIETPGKPFERANV